MSDEMDEIWALYADDGAQALDAMETALMAIGDGAGGDLDSHVAALFRAVHTFKGNSRVLGLAVVESRAHLAEDLIGLVRDQGVAWDAEIQDVMLLATDTLRVMLDETASTRADVDPAASEGVMAQLADKITRCGGTVALPGHMAALAAPAAAPADPAPVAEMAAAPEPVAVAETAAEPVLEPIPEPAPVAAAAPQASLDPEPAVAAAPAPKPAPAKPASSGPYRRLADDPTYREIFRGMSREAREKLSATYDGFASDAEGSLNKARLEADNLAHAARQMGLDDWVVALGDYLAATDTGSEPLAQLLLRIDELTESEFGSTTVVVDAEEEGTFFDRLRDPLAAVARMGTNLSCGEEIDPAELQAQLDLIQQATRPFGFVRVAEAAAAIAHATGSQSYRNAELHLYEELSAVEAVMPDAARASGLSPRELVQTWCAEHVFDTLAALEGTLNRLRAGGVDRDDDFIHLGRQFRLVFHACTHYRIETAAQLSMSLIDLFSRVHSSGKAPDAILTHIAHGFIDTIELVFDALYQGEIPDTATLEKLFEEAANVCFVQDGLMTASAIERRLGLPKEFHRVLSPDSVRAASDAIEAGKQFYIIRGDINNDEAIAEAFIDWLSSDAAESITNVTVFQGQDTLFDFLIASLLDEPSMVEAMARIDISGKKLRVLRHLKVASEESGPELAAHADIDSSLGQPAQGGVTAEMLESIGEIAASQSMISHILSELSEQDLMESIDAVLRSNEQDWRRARTHVRSLINDFSTRLQEIAQLEAQLVGQLAQLQEETVEIRSRAIETILRPLETFVQTHGRRNRREVRFSASGGELTLDITILDNLRKMLRSLILSRLELGDDAPTSVHVAFHRDEERVEVIVEDNGAASVGSPAIEDVQKQLVKSGGELRSVAVPGMGMRFHLTIPLAMVVLEGMVVGVEGVRYVVPVDAIRMILQPENELRFRVSAADGQEMLRIAEDEMVVVHSLAGGGKIATGGPRRSVYVVVGTQGRSVAVPVDELIGQQLVLLRPLRGVLSRMQNMTGIALLAGGDVGMVVSANMLCAATNETGRTTMRM